jgi:ATP-binding cassette subfamily B protein
MLLGQYLEQKKIEKISSLNIGVCDNSEFQDASRRSDRGMGMIDQVFLFQFNTIENLVTFLTSLVLISFVNGWYLLLIVISILPELYVSYIQEKRAYAIENDLDSMNRQAYQAESAFDVRMLPELVTYKYVQYFKTLFVNLVTSINGMYLKNNDRTMKENVIVNLCSQLPILVISVHLFYNSVYGLHTLGTSIGNLFMVLASLSNLKGSTFSFLEQFSDLPMKILRVKDFFVLLDTAITVEEAKNPKPIDVFHAPAISFKNVSFRYPNTDRDILKNVSFSVTPGEKVAFVGMNGAGKSTIMKLLVRLYDPTEGVIYINGIDVKDISFKDLYSLLGLARQNHDVHYGISIAENIFLGDITKPKDPVLLKEILGILNMKEYIQTLPFGVDQIVGNWFKDGLELSGGNYQKILLAKLLYKNSPLLVLDEPTSEMDAKSDGSFFGHIAKSSKTVVLVGHRLTTISQADIVHIIEEGRIVESGSVSHLIERAGLFYSMFQEELERHMLIFPKEFNSLKLKVPH